MLLCSVVQVAFETAAFLVLSGDQSLARRSQVIEARLQVRCQPDVSEDQAGLAGQVYEQVLLNRRQRLAGALGHAERTEQRPLMAHLDEPACAPHVRQPPVDGRY